MRNNTACSLVVIVLILPMSAPSVKASIIVDGEARVDAVLGDPGHSYDSRTDTAPEGALSAFVEDPESGTWYEASMMWGYDGSGNWRVYGQVSADANENDEGWCFYHWMGMLVLEETTYVDAVVARFNEIEIINVDTLEYVINICGPNASYHGELQPGTYYLEMDADYLGGEGSFDPEWAEIRFSVPEPTTLSLLALGGLA